MRRELQLMIEKLYKQYLKKRRWNKVVTFLAAIVVFCTTYALILPAITLETNCGYEDHIHEASCYENGEPEGLLVCMLEEHEHTEECYPSNEPEVITEEAESVNEPSEEMKENEIEENIDQEEVEQENLVEEIIAEESEDIPNAEELTENDETTGAEDTSDSTGNTEEIITTSEQMMAVVETEDVAEEAAAAEAEELSIEDENIIEEGYLNDTVWWKLTEDDFGYRTLTVGGEGAIPDYQQGASANDSTAPWNMYRKTIDKAVITDGITYMGAYAFHGLSDINAELEIEIGKDVKEIGTHALSYILGTVECLTIPGNVETLGDYIFAYSDGLRDIVLEEGVKSIGKQAFFGYGMGIKKLYFPSTLENITDYSGVGLYASHLEHIEVAEDNPIYYSEDGVLYKWETDSATGVTKTILVAYPPYKTGTSFTVTNVDEIEDSAFSQTKYLSEVNVIGSQERPITVGNYAFSNSSVEYVYFNDYTKASDRAMQGGFSGCKSLKKVIFPDGFITELGGTFTNCSSLQEFTITKSLERLHRTGLEETVALKKLTYDAANGHIASGIFKTAALPRYDLIIGANVNFLNAEEVSPSACEGFTVVVSRADSITFVGENQITVKEGAMTGAVRPLENVSGTIWVDNQGVVYLYDAENLTAKVIYCSPGVTDVTIPSTIEPEAVNVCTITGVASYAFEMSQVQSVSFETLENITSVESYAFANCITLGKINEKTTVAEAQNLFADVLMGEKAFYNTALTTDGTQGGETESEGNRVEEDVFISIGSSAAEDAGLTISTKKFAAYTGEEISTTVAFGVPNYDDIKDKVFRIYFSASAKDYKRSINDSFEATDSDNNVVNVTLKEIEGNSAYYLEIQGSELSGKTFSFDIRNTFPSPLSDGGNMQIWVQSYESVEAAKAEEGKMPSDLSERTYQEVTWTTLPAEPTLKKEISGTPTLTASGVENTAEVRNLAYKVTASAAAREIAVGVESCGLDIIRELEYEDVLTLPTGFYINPSIAEAINNGNYSYKFSSSTTAVLYTVMNGVQYEICTISNFTNMTGFQAFVEENGSLKLTWKLLNNQNTAEIAKKEFVITYGPHVIWGNMDTLKVGDTIPFINGVKTTANYTYLKESKSIEAQAEQTLTVKEADVTLQMKIAEKAEYFGEDLHYTITLSNVTAYPYENVGAVSDPLDSDLYIKPEAIQTMFDDPVSGDKLQIIIKNASLSDYHGGTATAVDGSTEVSLSATYAGIDTGYEIPMKHKENENSIITLKMESGKLIMSVSVSGNTATNYTIGEGETYKSIEDAFNAIGFFVSAGTTYEVQWLYNGSAIPGDTVITYEIPATVKDTFRFLGEDALREHNNEYVRVMNTATLSKFGETGAKKSASTPPPDVYKEWTIDKRATLDGIEFRDHFQVHDGAMIDYTVKLSHLGSADYEVLPVVDLMSGAQLLLVPADRNKDAAWTSGLKTYGDEAFEQYYILTEGTYKNVWITDELCADSVDVTKEDAGNVSTLIKFYYHNLSGKRDYSKTMTYKALVSPEDTGVTSLSYGTSNIAWVNDHQGYRLFAPISAQGSILKFEKDIVNERAELPADDVLNTEEHSVIIEGDTVTYRLNFSNIGNTKITLTGSEIFDALPQTRGAFAWGTDYPVQISYEADEGVRILNGDAWSILDNRPGGAETEAGQQYIVWSDDFQIEYPGTGAAEAYIYVTLQFPEQGPVWEDYFKNNANNILYSTLSVNQMTSQVSHELGDEGRALLQKGVYKIFSHPAGGLGGVWNTGVAGEFETGSREYYDNQDSFVRIITYYTVLHNSGNVRLYLNDLYDELPENFKYESLTNSTKRVSKPVNELGDTEGSAGYELVDVEGAKFISSSVRVTVTEGDDKRQRLRFTLRGENLSYDTKRGKYYLNPGEAIRFGYCVSTGLSNAEGVVSEAVNSIAMAYDDYTGLGLAVDTDTKVTVASVTGYEDMPVNDGDRNSWDSAIAASHGFSHAGADQWLASQVTIQKGNILPGLIKSAVKWISAATGASHEYDGSVDFTDTVVWETKAYNEGQSAINYYTLSDMMEAPYVFTGKVGLMIYDGQDEETAMKWAGHEFANDHLFEITERNGDQITVKSNLGMATTLTIGAVGTVKNVRVQGSTSRTEDCDIKVLFEKVKDENGTEHEKLSLIFDGSQECDAVLSIPKGGMAVLTLATVNPTNTAEYKTYVNTAYITPLSQNYSKELVTRGFNGVWEDNQSYVRNTALMTVSGAYSTTSKKAIYDKENEENRVESGSEENHIMIDNQEQILTYQLTVKTPDIPIKYMTLIDNLPAIGDKLTYASTVERSSEFKVDLLDNSDYRVTVTDSTTGVETELLSDQYVISYSQKTEGFTLEDKAGNGEGWTTDSTDARTLRLYINNENQVIGENAILNFYFDAKASADAQSGSIAWNSFGYSYKVGTTVLSAEPESVGVRFPSVPVLTKQLVSEKGQPHAAEENKTYRFVIYSGTELELGNMTNSELAGALKQKGDSRAVTFAELTVEAGKTESEALSLSDLVEYAYDAEKDTWNETANKWSWIDGASYTIEELPLEGNDIYRYKATNINGLDDNSFIYQKTADTFIHVINERKSGSLMILKHDQVNEYVLLSDAVFALYSQIETDAMTAEEQNEAKLLYDYMIEPLATEVIEGTTYYLTDIQATDGKGIILWEELYSDFYLIKELKAPAGYNLDDTIHKINIDFNEEQQSYAIANEGGYELPESGGIGTDALFNSGIALAMTAAAGISICNHTRLSALRKKSKGKDGKQS